MILSIKSTHLCLVFPFRRTIKDLFLHILLLPKTILSDSFSRLSCMNTLCSCKNLIISNTLLCYLSEMLESNNVITFSGLANSSSYHTFLLDEERSRLYVGAKDHIFSFNLVNIKDFQKVSDCITWTVVLLKHSKLYNDWKKWISILYFQNQKGNTLIWLPHINACV